MTPVSSLVGNDPCVVFRGGRPLCRPIKDYRGLIMWHMKTKLGTFWIIQTEEEHPKYFLGMDDNTLRSYDDVEEALQDVCNHTTGELTWDLDTRTKVPSDLKQWLEGEPEIWQKGQ